MWWRYLLLILIFIKMCGAVTNIGISSLYYPSVNESNVISDYILESAITPSSDDKFNQLMITQMKTKITSIGPLLSQTLSESKTFTVFDGNKIIASLSASESGLVTKWEFALDNSEAKESSADTIESSVIIKPVGDRYLLVGFIRSITAHQAKQVFPGTTNLSILHSLDIEIKYKLVDMNTKEVISHFVASGHGGIARIIPSDMASVIQNPEDLSDVIVNQAINSLVLNIKHGLLIQQELLK